MNHPTQRREPTSQLGQQVRHRASIGHVAGQHLNLSAGPRQVEGQLGGQLGATPAPTGQDDMAYPVCVHHMPGQLSTGHPGATGYQHRALGELSTQGRGHVQDNFADVAGLADEAIGLRGGAHIPGAYRRLLQHPGVEQLLQLFQHLLDAVRASLDQVKRLIAHGGILGGNHLGVADIGLAHLQKTPAADE